MVRIVKELRSELFRVEGAGCKGSIQLGQPEHKTEFLAVTSTYDHTHWRTRDPVRSPIDKPVRGGLVVGSVTTSESPLLYVFPFLCP
jgi:hypothetical protein